MKKTLITVLITLLTVGVCFGVVRAVEGLDESRVSPVGSTLESPPVATKVIELVECTPYIAKATIRVNKAETKLNESESDAIRAVLHDRVVLLYDNLNSVKEQYDAELTKAVPNKARLGDLCHRSSELVTEIKHLEAGRFFESPIKEYVSLNEMIHALVPTRAAELGLASK